MNDNRFQPGLPALLVLVAVFAAGLWARLIGVAWDEFAGFQPDERFLLFVVDDLVRGLDAALADGTGIRELWFGTGTSPLDPRLEGRSFVYGQAPVLSLTLVMHALGETDWYEALRVGRIVTASLDAFTVLAVGILAYELWKSAAAAIAGAALYAAAPTALQLAGFFTVDAWLTAAFAWCGASLALLTRLEGSRATAAALMAGAFMGLALACKVPGVLAGVAGLPALFLVYRRAGARQAAIMALAMATAALLTFRIADPFAFAGPEIWNALPSEGYVRDLSQALGRALSAGFPPDWQWLAGYSPLAFARDAALFGFGPAMTVSALVGTAAAIRRAPGSVVLALSLVVPVVAATAWSDTPALRYLAPALPAAAALAGASVWLIGRRAGAALVVLAAWWGAGVVSMHTSEHPRLAASRWLWTLPKGTVLANETAWDEGLPAPVTLPGGTGRIWPGHDNHFRLETLAMEGADDATKADRIARILAGADYAVISSGRQREVMPRLPDRFPLTTAYYRLLESGELCYASVWRSDPGYPLPWLRIDDSVIQEPWRVYDHPIVEIFRRQPCFDEHAVRARLVAALERQDFSTSR